MEATRGEKAYVVLPRCESYSLQYQTKRQGLLTGVIVGTTIMGTTNRFLIGF